MKYEVLLAGKRRTVSLTRKDGGWEIALDGRVLDANAAEVAPNTFSILLDGKSHEVRIAPSANGTLTVHTGFAEYQTEVIDPRSWRGRRHGGIELEGRQQIAAPMPGKVVRVLVKQGDAVEAGQGLIVVEAMKMQNEIRSPKSGRVERLLAQEGQAVSAGDVLVWVE